MHRKHLLVTLLSMIAIGSCSRGELTRSRAKDLISSASVIVEPHTSLRIDPDSFQDGAYWEYWDPAGKPAEEVASVVTKASRRDISLVSGVRIEVEEVTGITGMPLAEESVKQVEFTWSYGVLPAIVKQYASDGGTGTAVLRLYDDGWRLQGEPELQFNAQRTQLTADEKREVDAILGQIANRVRLEQEALQELQRKRDQAVLEAKNPGEVLGECPYTSDIRTRSFSRHERVTGKVTVRVGSVSLSGDKARGAKEPKELLFYDLWQAARRDVANVRITGELYTSATWGWKAYTLMIHPTWNRPYNTPLLFEAESQQEECYGLIKQGWERWKEKHVPVLRELL